MEECAEPRNLADRPPEEGLKGRAHPGNHHEDSPEAVDDARDRREHVGQNRDRRSERLGAHLRDEERQAERHGDREHECDRRSDQRSEDVGRRAEDLFGGDPLGAREEAESESSERL